MMILHFDIFICDEILICKKELVNSTGDKFGYFRMGSWGYHLIGRSVHDVCNIFRTL